MTTRTAIRLAAWIAAALLVASCGGARGTGAHAFREALEIDGHARLDRSVVPTRYELDLTIDPARASFIGEVAIHVEIAEPTDVIQLHAEDLNFGEVAVEVAGESDPVQVIEGDNGGIALVSVRPLPAGPAVLRFSYEAKLTTTPEGLFRSEDDGRWYAFTQFEPLAARQAFPCFDQPGFKTPFAVTLRVPDGNEGLGNAPEIARERDGVTTVIRLAETRPLPTYLVAFAVGPFDVVEAPEGSTSVPLRMIAARGKGERTRYAMERTIAALAWLEDYFGIPYPFAKLDMVAVPGFPLAMENVGLVTFAERLIVLDEDTASARDKLRSLSVIGHELGHMWFGNLVTLEWWNDLWLNEAFATWIESKVTHAVDPSLEVDLEVGADMLRVMSLDARKSARAIRQPIESGGDVHNAFDGLTYVKGASVVRMLEHWVGEEPFRRGIQSYMKAHAHGTATTAELLGELDRATGKDVSETIIGFLDQPGTPLVHVSPECGQSGATALDLRQTRYLPAGSDADRGEPWHVPVCFRFATGGAIERRCFLLDSEAKTVDLETTSCPEWIYPNAGELGYYRWRIHEDDLIRLVSDFRGQLTLAERIALADHLGALLEAEQLGVKTYLEALEELARGEHRFEIGGVIDALYEIRHNAVDSGDAAAFAAYARDLLGPHLERVGTVSSAGEGVQRALIRPRLILALAELGEDPALIAQAAEYADRFLDDPAAVDRTLADAWLKIAAQHGDRDLWERLKRAAAAEQDPGQRGKIVTALGAFRDPELLESSLNLLLDGTLGAEDLSAVCRSYGAWPEGRETAWRWLTANHGRLTEVIGALIGPHMPWLASAFCSEADRERVERFFSGLDEVAPGTERNLRLAGEYISQCARMRSTYTAKVGEYLTVR